MEITPKITVTPNPNDLKLTKEIYELAQESNMTLSAYLEHACPNPEPENGLDAFEVQLRRFGIRLKSDHEKGIYASKGELFFQSNVPASRVLFPEFISRTARNAAMLNEDYMKFIVSGWTNAKEGVFRSLYIDDTKTQRQSSRRAEGTLPAKTKVTWSEKASSLKDFAIEIDMSYEFVRQASLDIIQTVIGKIAAQRTNDETEEAIYVLLNGDGNSKEGTSATNVNLSTLGISNPTGTESITFLAYITWLAASNPYMMKTILASQADSLLLYNAIVTSSALTNPVLSGLGGAPKLHGVDIANQDIIGHSGMAADILLAVDPRYALEGYRDTGLDLVETNKLIDSKWNQIVISNKVGFATIFASARKTLTTNA